MEEGRDDEEAGTVERDTSQPEAVSALGEKTVVVIDREAGFSDSHQVRPLHHSAIGVDQAKIYCKTKEMKYVEKNIPPEQGLEPWTVRLKA